MYIALTNAIWCSLASRLIILGNSIIQRNKVGLFYEMNSNDERRLDYNDNDDGDNNNAI